MVSSWERALGMRPGQASSRVDMRDMERELEEARRAQAEARVAQARQDAEERRLSEAAQERLRNAFPEDPLFGMSGTGRDYRVEPRTAEEQQQARDLAEFALFGPERRSVLGGEAGRFERLLRDWGLSEQEFRLAGERAGEGRAGAAAGWAALGLAGAVPFFGDVAQGVGRAGRVASQAANVGHAVLDVPQYSLSAPINPVTRARDYGQSAASVPLEELPAVVKSDLEAGRVRLFHSTNSNNIGSIVESGLQASQPRSGAQIIPGRFVYGSSSPAGLETYGDAIVEYSIPRSQIYASEFSNFVSDSVSPDRIAAIHRVGPDGTILETVRVSESLGSVVERAADVGRVVPENIADNIINEINSGGLQYTKPNIENVVPDRRATAELAYRQGFEAPGRSLPSDDFERVVRELPQSVSRERLPFEPENAGQPIVVYRGLMDKRGVSGVDYGRSLIDGEYYVGHGIYGHGTYFSENFYDALNYSAIESGPSGSANGAIVRAVIPGDVRLLDFSNKKALRAYQQSPFSTVSEFAAANGYDGILIPKAGRNHVSMLNRSAMIFDSQPREVFQSDMIMLTGGRLTVPQIYEDLFRGGSNRQNVPQVQELPPEWEGLNF